MGLKHRVCFLFEECFSLTWWGPEFGLGFMVSRGFDGGIIIVITIARTQLGFFSGGRAMVMEDDSMEDDSMDGYG